MKLKLYKIVILIAIAISLSIFCLQNKGWILLEKPVHKSICLTVYTANDYSPAIYNNAFAKLSITITKCRGDNRAIVWNKTFNDLNLIQYPLLKDALQQKIVIGNVLDSKEHLEVTYNIIYNSKGSVLELQSGVLIPKGTSGGTLVISV